MDRRAVLAGVATLLAGCGSGSRTDAGGTDSPTPTRTGTAETGPGDDEDGGVPPTATIPGARGAFLDYLDRTGVAIESLTSDGDVAYLRYATDSRRYEEFSGEIGTVAGGFLRSVEEGWDRERMEATMLAPGGETLAYWYVEAAWGRQYRRGELTGQELSLKVLRTLQRPTATGGSG